MKNIKIITTADKGGLIDQVKQIDDQFNKIGLTSSIIRINKFKDRRIKNVNLGDNVIFQMSHYGYQKKGIPLWIIKELKKIKNKSSTFGIFFHELFVNEKIWNYKFILGLFQKYINIKILKYSDYWITSNINYFKWLEKYSTDSKKYICPVHSNINHKVIHIKKKNYAVIFGTEGSRSVIYDRYWNNIKEWSIKNNITLFDVGPKMSNFDLQSICDENFKIQIMGKLSIKKVANLFSKVSYGIFITPHELIDKSGVMAAYSSYKICPINLYRFLDKKNKSKNRRFLKNFPHIKNKKLKINNIINLNYKLSKENNLNKLIKIYVKNFI